jgi:hypothetical protein
VTLSALSELSAQAGYELVELQAAAGSARLVDSLLRHAQARLDAGAGPWKRAKRTFERLAGINLGVAGITAGLSTHAPRAETARPASPEDLAMALATLAREVRRETPQGGVLITVDEIQVAHGPDLALLAAALGRLNVQHPDAPVMFAATGLPHTAEVLSHAKVTHPDRLFDLRNLPQLLEEPDARFAIVEPARARKVIWQLEAADLIVQTSNRYPAHLQLFAHHAWSAAQGPDQITLHDAQTGVTAAAAEIERRTLGPRFDRLAERQREFLTAIAVHGGRCSTANLALVLGREPKSLSQLRDTLISEGDVYVPRRGELALTVPLFARYLVANYEPARTHATSKLLPLEEMTRNLQALEAAALARTAQPHPALAPSPTTPAQGEQQRAAIPPRVQPAKKRGPSR